MKFEIRTTGPLYLTTWVRLYDHGATRLLKTIVLIELGPSLMFGRT